MHLWIRPHLCQVCGQRFGEDSELQSHIKNRHSADKEFQCDHCPYATANKATFYSKSIMTSQLLPTSRKITLVSMTTPPPPIYIKI